jgi:hypothetical protein
MFTQTQLDAERPTWVLRLTYAGRVLFFGSEATTIDTDDGDALNVIPYGEAGAHEEAIGLWEPEPRIPEIPFTLLFPYGVDVALLHARGHDLVGSRAEWSCVYPGQTWEQRTRLLAGEVYTAAYGAAQEPVTLSIRGADVVDRGRILDASMRVSGDTWPSATTSAQGQPYPLVFGQPGPYTHPDGTSGNTSGSPALLVSSTRILIAGHATEAGRDGSNVRLFASDDSAETFAAEHTSDGLGRTVTTCDVSGAATLTVSGDLEYWCRWDDGGGLLAPDGRGAGRAGQLVRALMRGSSLRSNGAVLASAAPALDRYELAGFINDPEATPLGWILDNLIPLLPVSSAPTADGITWIPWDPDAPASATVAALTMGPDLQRIGLVQIEGRDEIVNAPSLEYAPRARTDAYQALASVAPGIRGPQAEDATTEATILGTAISEAGSVTGFNVAAAPAAESEIQSPYARISAGRYGERAAAASTEIVYDGGTAVRILRDRTRMYAFPRARIRYRAHPRYAHLRAGDLVLLTDEDLHYTEQIAIVSVRRWAEGEVVLDLLVIPDPVRDSQP